MPFITARPAPSVALNAPSIVQHNVAQKYGKAPARSSVKMMAHGFKGMKGANLHQYHKFQMKQK